tara:strand:+ start:1719 stop:2522 length:804 start_codon:yes stop_codon:yes gene_type:complete
MKCTFYGVCGSYPSISPDSLPIRHTACVAIETNDFLVIFDAGSGIINLGHSIRDVSKPIFLLFSHFHYDHIIGLPYFSPLYDPRHNITILHPNPKKINSILAKIFNSDFFPIPYSQLPKPIDVRPLDFCKPYNFSIIPYSLNHPGGCLGYRFIYHDTSVIYATDNQLDTNNLNDFSTLFKCSSLLIHDCYFFDESQENLKTWGHTFLPDLLSLSLSSNIDHLCPFHFKPDINHAYLNSMKHFVDSTLKEKQSPMSCTFAYDGFSIDL